MLGSDIETTIWIPVFATATSWVGQHYILEQHPVLMSEHGLNTFTRIIEQYRQEGNYAFVDLLEMRRSFLETCIEEGLSSAFKPYLINDEEFELSLLISLQVFFQASLWTLNASQLMRGPELLSATAEKFLRDLRMDETENTDLIQLIDTHRDLLVTSRQLGIVSAFEPRVEIDYDEKPYSIEQILKTTKLLTERYKILKNDYKLENGYSSIQKIIDCLSNAPSFHLTSLTHEIILAFANMLCADSFDKLRRILTEIPEIYSWKVITDLTAIESGDTRGLLTHFHSVEVIRILSLASRIGPKEAIDTIERTYKLS